MKRERTCPRCGVDLSKRVLVTETFILERFDRKWQRYTPSDEVTVSCPECETELMGKPPSYWFSAENKEMWEKERKGVKKNAEETG